LQQSEQFHDDIIYPSTIAFILMHVACLGIIWTGVSAWSLLLCLGLYLVRMWAITAGNHRYFSHRTYKTSRIAQFMLGVLCQTSAQKGVLWWAAKHRHHHRYSDTPNDVHSPKHHGFLFAHMGWIFARVRGYADYGLVTDLTKYRELVWLNRVESLPAAILAVSLWWFGGWEALFVGFFLSTVLLYHGTFAINSMAHVIGKRRYRTGDDSRNNWWLALITLGEGWHNNHHHFQSSTRQGFRWYEIDITFYVLKAMSWAGLVWDLKSPPKAVVRGEHPLRPNIVDTVAQQLAQSFSCEQFRQQARGYWSQSPNLEQLREQAQEAWENSPSLEEMRQQAHDVWSEVVTAIGEAPRPHIPSLEEIKHRAIDLCPDKRSLDEIAERARALIVETVSTDFFEHQAPAQSAS
jgi:stearoyl-CoA desaturase (delta-9 desaturase)